MAQYLVLIYEDESGYANGGADIWAEVGKEHTVFAENIGAAMVGGNALQPTATATSIRSDGNGDFTVTDAPFAEAKEALGGYYLLEAPDLDAAIALAKQCPARFGGVEVRPIMVFE